MSSPLVVKFGGDALAAPERIAAAARRVAARRATRPVVAVASARRGVTDHLLGLVEQVREAVGVEGDSPAGRAAADRAVASGELVAAALLAVALADLGVRAVVLDAREAGLASDGHAGGATLTRLRLDRLRRLLDRGVTPVVTGFQGWHRGRITTLGRGGSDITAVALAAALGAEACELVKDPGALHTADPRLVAEAHPLRCASHRFVSEIALAGARVIHHDAATRAERDAVPLRFTSLHADGEPSTVVDLPATRIDSRDGLTTSAPNVGSPENGYAVVVGTGYRGIDPGAAAADAVASVSLVSAAPDPLALRAAARAAAALTGIDLLRTVNRPHALAFLVAAADARGLAQALHSAVGRAAYPDAPSSRSEPPLRIASGHA